ALILSASQAQAADFSFGADDDILLKINSELTFGSSWRLGDANPYYIGQINKGTGATATTDDGNLNYAKGDAFSTIVKGIHDIQLSKGDFGAFVRFKYWYDYALKDGDVLHGNGPNGYIPNTPLSDDGFENNSKFSGVALLDAYLYGSFYLGESALDVRLGRQVLSWGESTFIQGGLNSTNPFDVPALRRPGATLKEGILPVGMLSANLGLTDNLSIEAFYQYEWEKTLIDNCGTYFANADFAASGCNFVSIGTLDHPGTPSDPDLEGEIYNDKLALDNGWGAHRRDDLEPDDGGQYGLAARYYAESLNDTEFGLYYMNIHSRVPLINAIRTNLTPAVVGIPDLDGRVFLPNELDPTGGKFSSLNPAYLIEFPEDLQYYGVSFATNISSLALSGEISYKPDTPIQINGSEILNGVMSEAFFLRYSPRVTSAGYGEMIKGYDELDVTQMQMTAVQFFENTLGASRVTFVGEVGMVMTDGAEDSTQLYGRNTVFGLGDFHYGDADSPYNCKNLQAAGSIGGDCRTDGFVTDSAWGYRAKVEFDYADAFAGISLKPSIFFSHDVSGYSADPGQQFSEGRKVVALGLEATYLQAYTAKVGYNTFFDGTHNVLTDKDFVSVSFGISY
ncbi:MAG: DUF1302 domain-containing protein, partial [Colwellia sp.]